MDWWLRNHEKLSFTFNRNLEKFEWKKMRYASTVLSTKNNVLTVQWARLRVPPGP